jgi:CheY-like chemotaxis protein
MRDDARMENADDPRWMNDSRRVMVAEDDSIIRYVIATLLLGRGFAVTAVDDGEQAWEALRRQPFDALVTDNQMPGLTGLKLIEQIRAAGLKLPVIVVSGSFSAEEARNHPELHIDQVFSKPFNPSELVKAVQLALFSGGDFAAGDARVRKANSTRQLNCQRAKQNHMTTMNNPTLSSDEIRETDSRVQSHWNDGRSTSRKHGRWTRWKCWKGKGMNREHQDEGRVVASFGDADLIRHDNGRWELRGGSPTDQAEAREYCSLFQHEATFARAPLPITAPQVVTRKAAQNRILIADDDALVRESLAAVLASEGFIVDEASNGTEAVARALAHAPDLVLLDLNMPKMDGWTAFAKLDHVRPLVPVIVITARPNQYREAVRLGVDAFMEKPLDFPKLMGAIKQLMNEDEGRHVRRITNPGFVTRLLNSNTANHS